MTVTPRVPTLFVLCTLTLPACQQQPASTPPTTTPPAAAPTNQPSATTSPSPLVKPADAIASRRTNWGQGQVVADVMEFRRAGNTLTAVVRLRNESPKDGILISTNFAFSYVLDEAQGRKYEVLEDEKGGRIASPGDTLVLEANKSLNVWMKFPAPPPEVKAATLTVRETLPFENVPIQSQP